ncbi:MAG: hypothetical protein ACYSUR_03080, partial [Planctomycetota bacterium]
MRKVPFWCGGAVPPQVQERAVHLGLWRLADGRPRLIDETTARLRVRRPTDRHRRTFTSAIDGSVQYFAVTPMRREQPSGARPA